MSFEKMSAQKVLVQFPATSTLDSGKSSENESDSIDSSDGMNDSDSDSSQEQISQLEAIKQYLYPKTIERIRQALSGQKIFVSLTFCNYDRQRNHPDDVLANIIVGPMVSKAEPKQNCFLLKSLSTNSYQNYSKDFLVNLFNDAMVCKISLLLTNFFIVHLGSLMAWPCSNSH